MTEPKIRIVKRVMLDNSIVFVIQRRFNPFNQSWLEVTSRDTLCQAMLVIEQLRKVITNHDEVVYSE